MMPGVIANLVISAQIPSDLSIDRLVDAMVKIEDSNFGNSTLHQSREELERMALDKNFVFVGVYSGELVGYCAGTSIEKFMKKHPLIESTRPVGVRFNKVVYVESFELSPSFQGKGIGAKLMKKFIEEARNSGFSFIAGHAREGSSYAVVRSVLRNNIIVNVPVENYFATGETYHYVLSKMI